MNYRHAFHAGNFADVMKHAILVRILAYLHVSHAGIYAFSDRVMVGESEELRLMDPISAVRKSRNEARGNIGGPFRKISGASSASPSLVVAQFWRWHGSGGGSILLSFPCSPVSGGR